MSVRRPSSTTVESFYLQALKRLKFGSKADEKRTYMLLAKNRNLLALDKGASLDAAGLGHQETLLLATCDGLLGGTKERAALIHQTNETEQGDDKDGKQHSSGDSIHGNYVRVRDEVVPDTVILPR